MELTQKSSAKVAGGDLSFWRHQSKSCHAEMNFSVFVPAHAEGERLPVLYWLSGLTCTEENFMIKAAPWLHAAAHGLILVAPDTSPRGLDLPGEHENWDFGSGAGFYVNATQAPWSAHYHMDAYVTEELPAIIAEHFPVDPQRAGVSGHSMGGHGALVLSLRNPGMFKSVSAFAPICHPSECPWGHKALGHYLGPDREIWAAYDACELLAKADNVPPLLVDQGTADGFLQEQLKPDHLEKVCHAHGHQLTLRMQAGYDHGYYFVATFMGDHIAHHAKALKT